MSHIHICIKKSCALHYWYTFTGSLLTSIVLIIKSTPIVEPWPGGNKPWKIKISHIIVNANSTSQCVLCRTISIKFFKINTISLEPRQIYFTIASDGVLVRLSVWRYRYRYRCLTSLNITQMRTSSHAVLITTWQA